MYRISGVNSSANRAACGPYMMLRKQLATKVPTASHTRERVSMSRNSGTAHRAMPAAPNA